jgi:Beta-propeller repeat
MKTVVSSLLCVCGLVVCTLAADRGGIVYSTHFTGVSLQAIAVDRHGNVYVTGGVPGSGIFVAKLNPAGQTIYSKTIGGLTTRAAGSQSIGRATLI